MAQPTGQGSGIKAIVRITQGDTVRLPEEICAALGITEGDDLKAEIVGGALKLTRVAPAQENEAGQGTEGNAGDG